MPEHIEKPLLDPMVKNFLEDVAKKSGKPIYELSVENARKVLSDLQQAYFIEPLPAHLDDMSVPGGPHGSIDVRIIRPVGVQQRVPAIIYIHGGGWVLGDKDTHARFMSELANGVQAAVVFVDYKRAPEAQYPSIHEEAYAVAAWVDKNAEKLNVDAKKMAIAGDSAGGLVATAVCLMAHERGGPQFVYQLLLYPVTDANFDTPSYQQFATGYFLEKAGMEWFWDAYVPDKSMRKNPLVAPLQATSAQLKHLPPALVLVGEADVLRSEGEAYAQKMAAAGVPVILERVSGVVHDFAMLNAITKVPEVRAALADAFHLVRHAFGLEK